MEIIKIKKEKFTCCFDEIAEQWLSLKKINIKKSTYSNYKYTINKYIMPYLQGKRIKELKKYDFNELVNELNLELASKTVRDIIGILKQILCYIEDEYNCKFKIKKIISPKLNTEKVIVFSKSEKKKIENYCIKSNGTRELGILICLNTGLRIGEICALKWENIDLDRRVIYIKSTLERIYDENLKRTNIVIDKPKTKHSIREIPISNKLYDILKPLKKQYKDSEFFLTGEKDKYVEPRNYQYVYKKILKKCKIKQHKFHCLRHTFATDCIEVGMDIKALSEILGHANVNITLNIYVHSSYKLKKKYLEKI